MRKKQIAIISSPIQIEKRLKIEMLYDNAIYEYGAIPVRIPITNNDKVICDFLSSVDGVLMTGGCDINPQCYGEENCHAVNIDNCRDIVEKCVIEFVLTNNIPVLGICRGLQALNVFSGGTLNQHIDNHSDTTHDVIVHSEKFLSLVKQNKFNVNSIHHQSIKQIAPNWKVSAYASDGTIEAIEHNTNDFAYAVQWHPERMPFDNEISTILFNSLIKASP